MRTGQWRMVVAGLAVATLLLGGAGTAPAASEEQGYWSEAGLGAASTLANVVYMPVKLVYATLGIVTGGLTYALTGGSYETAENVWVASVGGTYVVVPGMLTGEVPIEFSGTPRLPGGSIVEEPTSLAQEPAPAGSNYGLGARY